MELRWLETFAVAAREGSMSAAAEELGYARSTVTGHIQSLERSLGVKLLDRRAAGHALSSPGEALLGHAQGILERVGRARVAVLDAEERSGLSLRLGATDSVCAYRLPVFLRMLDRLVPGLKVQVEAGPAGRLRERVAQGKPECVLVSGARTRGHAGEYDDDDLTARRVLWEEEAVMVGTPNAVARSKCVLLTGQDCVYRDITERDFLSRMPGVDVLPVGNLEGVKSAALAGLGVGLLPMVAVKPWLPGRHLVRVPLRTDQRVVTELVWNRISCPDRVSAHLEQLRSAGAVVPAVG